MNKTTKEIYEDIVVERCEAMLLDHMDVVLDRVRHKIKSGVLAPCNFKTRTAMAKVTLTSALRDCTDIFAPPNDMYAEDLRNLDKV